MTVLLRHQALLALMAVVIFFTNLGSYALFNEDEPKNASCGAEMFRRGDVIVPTFNEALRTDKPILIYWLMLTSYKFFGISEFSARFASALLSVGTTLLTYHLGRKLYSAEIGILASCILCTCLLFTAVGRAVTPDATLIFFVTLTFTCYVWVVARQRGGNFSGDSAAETDSEEDADEAPSELNQTALAESDSNAASTVQQPDTLLPSDWKWAAPLFAAMGFAVLAKGPVGVVLPSGILILFLLISWRERDIESEVLTAPTGPWWKRWWRIALQTLRPRQILQTLRGMHFLIGLGIVIAIALPWYLVVGYKTNGEWLRGFFLDHNLNRALTAKENHNGFPFYQLYYVVAILVSCFPWSVFLPVAVFRMGERFIDGARWRDSDRLVACWAGTWFIFFSLASTRLPNYLLPMYPAVALILGRYLHDWRRDEVDEGVYSFNLCCRALGLVGILMVIGVYIAAYVLFSSEQWLALIGLVPIAGAYIAMKFLDQELRTRVIQTLVAMSILLAVLVVGVAPVRVNNYQDTPKFIADARRLSNDGEVEIGTFRYFQPSVVYYAGYAGKRVTVLHTPRDAADFIAGGPHRFIITPVSKHNELRDELPGNIAELSRHRNFLRRTELILLGRQ
ncbi:ArnT family glycosyltransferase [Schlesneria sp. T3-172]|uniref:ArnT family glycosyltransferase n=1 Tax=Schlesneria TaxID=656899 RepID=UPI002EFADAC7